MITGVGDALILPTSSALRMELPGSGEGVRPSKRKPYTCTAGWFWPSGRLRGSIARGV